MPAPYRFRFWISSGFTPNRRQSAVATLEPTASRSATIDHRGRTPSTPALRTARPSMSASLGQCASHPSRPKSPITPPPFLARNRQGLGPWPTPSRCLNRNPLLRLRNKKPLRAGAGEMRSGYDLPLARGQIVRLFGLMSICAYTIRVSVHLNTPMGPHAVLLGRGYLLISHGVDCGGRWGRRFRSSRVACLGPIRRTRSIGVSP